MLSDVFICKRYHKSNTNTKDVYTTKYSLYLDS